MMSLLNQKADRKDLEDLDNKITKFIDKRIESLDEAFIKLRVKVESLFKLQQHPTRASTRIN